MQEINNLYTSRILTENGKGPVILFITGPFMQDQTDCIYEKVKAESHSDFILCELVVNDWDSLLTPWICDEKMGERSFGGNGKILLNEINSHIIPEINKQYPIHKEIIVAGYSLAGLFSVWSLYESDLITGAISCSGSLWYPGWNEYVNGRKITKDIKAYISLGLKEEKTKNQLMKIVGERTKLQYELFNNGENKVCLEWNQGGHFTNVNERIIRGMTWILSQ